MSTGLLDGGSGTDGGGNGDAGNGGDAAASCAQLLSKLDQARQAAIQCCPTCNVSQCTQQVDGLCCKLTVTSQDSQAVQTYLAALKAVQDANCQVACPAVPCPAGPSNVCGPSSTCVQ